MKVTASIDSKYGEEDLKRGRVYDLEEADARFLQRNGLVRPANDEDEKKAKELDKAEADAAKALEAKAVKSEDEAVASPSRTRTASAAGKDGK